MNRPIRFRVWDGETMHEALGLVDLLNDERANDARYAVTQAPGDCVLMQSTGLTDAEGREVFEGDVVFVGTSRDDRYGNTGPVMWDKMRGGFSLPGRLSMEAGEESGYGYYFWVIGHIYEPRFAHLREQETA